MKKLWKLILIILVLVVGGAFVIKPTLKNISYGIDLQGGFEILYNIEPLEANDTLTEADLENTYKTIVNRIDTLGVSEPVITLEGGNLIRIQLPGVSNEDEARSRISTTAVLSFRDVDDNLLLTSDVLGRNGATVELDSANAGLSYQVKLDVKDTTKFYNATKEIAKKASTGDNLMITWLDFTEGEDSYKKRVEEKGNEACSDMKCISAAYVKEGLSSSNVVITGNFTKDQAQYLADLINSGSLPTKLTEEATPKSVSPSFGAETISKTGIAGIVTFVLISLILIFKYRLSGLLGSVCLFAYAILVFLIFNAIDGVLTLTGIAALVLGIGMAVDSIIISNERIKDEIFKSNKLAAAYKEGNKSSLIAIIDANITTLIAGIVLYIFGESTVKGFATMLIITIIVTIITIVVLYRLLLAMAVKSKSFNEKPNALFGKIKEHKDHNYVKSARIPIIVSTSIIAVGVAFVIVRGFNFGVDFTGGTNIGLSSTSEIDFNKVKEIVKDYDIRGYDYYMGTKNEGYIVLNDILSEENEIKVKNALTDLGIESSSSEISTLVTESLTKNAIEALIYACIAIVIYMIIRFNFNYAITGILMLIHDVLVILAIFAILHISVDFILVAALLTIIGYSINDTIVVFDRVRANKKKIYRNKKKLSYDELEKLVNVSGSETFNRNLWTSITTIISVVALLASGLNAIFTFNVAILIGLVAGTISSLLIGPRIWMIFESKSMNNPDEYDDGPQELKVKGIND